MHGIEILLLIDEAQNVEPLKGLLAAEGYGVTVCLQEDCALQHLTSSEFDLVIIDIHEGGASELSLLRRTKEMHPGTEVIIISDAADVEVGVEAIKYGAFHYLPKPYEPEEAKALVKQALDKRILTLELQELGHIVSDKRYIDHLIGKSPKMQQLKKEIARVAPLDCTVLIRGETGTGKELVARIIHRMSTRGDRRFLAVNCGTLNEELLSNELFGHEKEAFTGANKVKKGVFEALSEGTILLDEIGDMPISMQIQLLRVLQEKTVTRVGGTEEIPVDVRVLAATNRSLKAAMEKGAFREDLFYRLNVFSLRIPPLRERRDDIPLFCRSFLDKYSREFNKDVYRVSDRVMDIFFSYPFPGNVRELENAIERAVILTDSPVIEPVHLPRRMQGHLSTPASKGGHAAGELLSLEELEQRHIKRVLEAVQGNRKQAANILGIDRVSLWRKMKKYGLYELEKEQ